MVTAMTIGILGKALIGTTTAAVGGAEFTTTETAKDLAKDFGNKTIIEVVEGTSVVTKEINGEIVTVVGEAKDGAISYREKAKEYEYKKKLASVFKIPDEEKPEPKQPEAQKEKTKSLKPQEPIFAQPKEETPEPKTEPEPETPKVKTQPNPQPKTIPKPAPEVEPDSLKTLLKTVIAKYKNSEYQEIKSLTARLQETLDKNRKIDLKHIATNIDMFLEDMGVKDVNQTTGLASELINMATDLGVPIEIAEIEDDDDDWGDVSVALNETSTELEAAKKKGEIIDNTISDEKKGLSEDKEATVKEKNKGEVIDKANTKLEKERAIKLEKIKKLEDDKKALEAKQGD